MKTKIILRLLNKDQYPLKNQDVLCLTHSEMKINLPNSPSQNEDVIDVSFTENKEHKHTVADLIIFISQHKKICPDTLQLYSINQNIIKLLKDTDHLNDIHSDIENISVSFQLSTNQDQESSKNKTEGIILYYTLNNIKMKISVDFYQMKIDKIYLKLAYNCSILMLKHIISNKLNNVIQAYNQKIFGLGLLTQNNKVKYISLNNKEFNDELRFIDIVNCYDSNSSELNVSNYALHFLLSSNINNKLQM